MVIPILNPTFPPDSIIRMDAERTAENIWRMLFEYRLKPGEREAKAEILEELQAELILFARRAAAVTELQSE